MLVLQNYFFRLSTVKEGLNKGCRLDRVKRLNEMGVARVVPMFPPEKADKVLPMVDRWTKIMQQVNG